VHPRRLRGRRQPFLAAHTSRFVRVAIIALFAAVVLGGATAPVAVAAAPPNARRIAADVSRYLETRTTAASVLVLDLQTHRTYRTEWWHHYDTASIVKVSIMAAVLRRQEDQHRHLTGTEDSLIHRMIQYSDNNAASALWREIGEGPGLQRFLDLAGMSHTIPGSGGFWGLTQTTVGDQVHLLDQVMRPSSLLRTGGRRYAIGRMASVTSSQRWGVSAGPPPGSTIQLKNGWLPESTHGWQINSIGHIAGSGRDYLIAVLSEDNGSFSYGVSSVEAVSRLVWRDLDPFPSTA
jgi:hypothetical protein